MRRMPDGVVELWKVTHAKTGDALLVRIYEVLHDSAHELGVDPGLVKDGVEADLQRLLAEQVDVIGDGSPGPPGVPDRDRSGRPAAAGRGGRHASPSR